MNQLTGLQLINKLRKRCSFDVIYHVIDFWIDLLVDFCLRIHVGCTKNLRTVEVVKDVHETSSIPVIGDSTPVVDVPSGVY